MTWYRMVETDGAKSYHRNVCEVCHTLIEHPENYKWLAHRTVEIGDDEVTVLRLEGYVMEGEGKSWTM